MSSHHIVRDEQEPAIVIAEMGKQHWSAIQQLLGWIPTVLVDEEFVDDVLLMGIKIDIVICQEQILPYLKEKLKDQQPIKFITKQEDSMPSIAVSYLKEKGYIGVNIFGKFDVEKSLPINDQITAIWYDEKYRYILSNQHVFQKWMIKDSAFCLLPTKKDQFFELENVNELEIMNTYLCTCDGKVLISSNGDFWIGEQLY